MVKTTVDWRAEMLDAISKLEASISSTADVLARAPLGTWDTAIAANGGFEDSVLGGANTRPTDACLIDEITFVGKESLHFRLWFFDSINTAVPDTGPFLENIGTSRLTGEVDLDVPVSGFQVTGGTLFYMTARLATPIFYKPILSVSLTDSLSTAMRLQNLSGVAKTAGSGGDLIITLKGRPIPD